jgi:2-polyprenyl-3-methyl-5-hydroxy-6-metoxy-1,4-benzoquinol methylase
LKILDIGCGIGYDSKILSNFGFKVTGIDFSKNVIDIAKSRVDDAEFRNIDIHNSIIELGKFDGAICLETLDYILPENMKTVIDNIASVLKSGALLLVSVLDGSNKNMERSLVTLDNQKYDKNFYCYDVEKLCTYAYPNFKLVDTWQFNDFDEGWRYYVFMKQITQ